MQMETGISIKWITEEKEIRLGALIIAAANRGVAGMFGLTPENAPSNPAFITPDRLASEITDIRKFYMLYIHGEPAGTVAVESVPDDPEVFYIERLAVKPEWQGKGLGRALMDFAHSEVVSGGGLRSSVAIINENSGLKKWYAGQGYRETGLRRFDHLPFTVCFMVKELG